MDEPLISVIMPVYNTVQYLDRSLTSLTKQTWHNLDIVVIDDGSTDGSAEALDAWADRDSRIRVVHQPNAGVAAARNRGLDEARGAMIAWLDSDDWIEPDYVRELAEMKIQTGADMVENFRGSRRHPDKLNIIEGDDIIRDSILGRLSRMLWCTLCDANKYQGFRFLDLPIGEDTYMLLQVRSRCQAEAVRSIEGYHYTMRDDSAVHGINYEKLNAWMNGLDLRKEFIEKNCRSSIRYMSYHYMTDSMMMLRLLGAVDSRDRLGLQLYGKLYKQVSISVRKVPMFSLNINEMKEVLAAVKFLLLNHAR